MAHFVKLNSDNIVIDVLVVSNDDIQNLPFPESEPLGVAFLQKLFGEEDGITWKQTSYNRNFRGNYAGIGINTIKIMTFLFQKNRSLVGF